MTLALVALVVLDFVLVSMFVARPSLVLSAGGRVLAFIALFLLPSLVLAQGLSLHLERSKTKTFCLSCHVMEPYGRSLNIDSPDALPAAHFQNRRIDRNEACYTCHTTYAMFGDVKAKLNGLRHLLVYLDEPPETIRLYEPYHNRECLHCHAGARSFETSELHAEIRAELASNEASCLECHDVGHDVAALDEREFWAGGNPE